MVTRLVTLSAHFRIRQVAVTSLLADRELLARRFKMRARAEVIYRSQQLLNSTAGRWLASDATLIRQVTEARTCEGGLPLEKGSRS